MLDSGARESFLISLPVFFTSQLYIADLYVYTQPNADLQYMYI